jgi:hypothetical protein
MTTQSDGLRLFGRDGKVYVRQLILHNCLPEGKDTIEIKVQRGKYNAEGNVQLEDSNVKPHIDPVAKVILFSDVFVNKEFGLIISLSDGGKVQFSPEFKENELLRFATLDGEELNADVFAIVDKLP